MRHVTRNVGNSWTGQDNGSILLQEMRETYQQNIGYVVCMYIYPHVVMGQSQQHHALGMGIRSQIVLLIARVAGFGAIAISYYICTMWRRFV